MTQNNEIENKKEKLSERINLRLTKDEYLKLKIKADEQNLSISNYLRSEILRLTPPITPLNIERKVRKRVRDFPKIDPELNRQLVSIGRNLNQITKIANSQKLAFGISDTVSLQQSVERVKQELNLLRQHYTASNQNAS